LITESPIRFVFRGTVVEHKPRPHWATVHAVVAVFSDYSRRVSRRKRRLYSRQKRRLSSPKIVAAFGYIVAVPYFRFRQLYNASTSILQYCRRFRRLSHRSRRL